MQVLIYFFKTIFTHSSEHSHGFSVKLSALINDIPIDRSNKWNDAFDTVGRIGVRSKTFRNLLALG